MTLNVLMKKFKKDCGAIGVTTQKMKFSIKDFFSKCDQIGGFGHIHWRNP